MSESGQKPIADKTRHRHWHHGFFSRGQQQPVVLKAERHFETSRFKLIRRDHAPVTLVDRCREQRVSENFQKNLSINSKLPTKRKSFAQAFDNGREQEITAQLDYVSGVSFLAQCERLLSHCVKQSLAALNLFGAAGGDNEQLRCRGSLRPAKNGRGQIVLLPFAMTFGQSARQCY